MSSHVGPGSRDWSAEKAEVEREYAEAKATLNEAFEAVRPGSPTRIIATEDMAAFGIANERFEAAKTRRKAFLRERAAHEV